MAREKAMEGITQSHREWEVLVNPEGEECELPTKEKGGKGKDKGGGRDKRGGGGGGGGHHGGHSGHSGRNRRSRSRSRDRRGGYDDRDRDRGGRGSSDMVRASPMALELPGGIAAPNVNAPKKVVISGSELDEMIDGVERACQAAKHAASLADNMKTCFTKEAQHMETVVHMLNRFRRSF